MNCKPGDLAMVVRTTTSDTRWMLGRVVQCDRLETLRGRPGWYLVEPLEQPAPSPFAWSWIADDCLTPIRDPGDDAKDELLRPLPADLQAVSA